MNFNPDDPKWTAYVLGELDPSERAELDTLLQNSEEARAYLQELQDATDVLHEEMKVAMVQPSNPGLTREQRAAVHAAAGNPAGNGKVRWWSWNALMVGGAVAVAAMILFAVAVPQMRKSAPESSTYRSVMQSKDVPAADTPLQAAADTQKKSAKDEAVPQNATKPLAAPAGASAPEQPTLAVVATPVESSEKTVVIAASPQAQSLNATRAPIVSSLSGTVMDSSRALIPGVTVTAKNTETGVVTTAFTNDSGAYSIGNLTPGTYQLTAGLSGFQTATVPNFSLGGSDPQRFNLTLNIGSSGQTVQVAAEASSTLRESSASVGEVLSESQVQQLPLVGNNVLQLLTVLPGNTAASTPTNVTRDGLSANPNSTLTGDALLNLPNNQDDLKTYLTQLALSKSGADGTTVSVSVDGFNGGQAQARQQGQGQGQGQQGQAAAPAGGGRGGAGGGGGGGRGGGGARGGGAAAGGAPANGPVAGRGAGGTISAPAAAAAPPPPPPPATLASVARGVPAPAGPRPTDNVNRVDNFERNTAPGGNYSPIVDNPFKRVLDEPLSTFSSDVDTASYANLRRFLTQNQAPPRDAVRIEEMVNYFNYDYPQPTGSNPIGAQLDVASAPWSPSHRLVRIGIKARESDSKRRPSSNLVFLIDVSGSMQPPDRLPLIKSGLKMLTNQLSENDHVAIVVYAGNTGVALPYTSGDRKDLIMRALDNLEAGGSTNGGAGIQAAYQIASTNFIPGGINRVILATDGDFNVGVVNQGDLVRMIQDKAKTGVFLSVLGVGTDNLNDSTMKRLADNGNGNYAYLDSQGEAYKVLVEQMGGTLETVAKDVKLQVEFNPAVVEAYRLIGYESRLLANSDFNNDRKDAGDMGAGHTVTALYEIVPRGGEVPGPGVDALKYQPQAADRAAAAAAAPNRNTSNEMLTLKIRYKDPNGTESKLFSLPLTDRGTQFSRAPVDFRFAASVAEFGMILRDSTYRGNASINDVLNNAQGSKGTDKNGYRQEFIDLVTRARSIRGID